MLLRLLRFRLRRDRLQLTIWTVSLFALLLFTAQAMISTYPSVGDRIAVLRLALITPALLVLRGMPQGPGIGDITVFEIATFQALLVGLMSTFLVVRGSRAEEEQGQGDLLSATVAGRTLPAVATALEALLAAALAGVASTLGLLAGGLPVTGSVVFGAALGAAGCAFAGLQLIVVQLAPTGRSANGWGTALVLVAYALRGFGDANGTPHPASATLTPAWPSAISPIGWVQATRPYASDDLRPALLALGVGLGAVLVALVVQRTRDVGAAVLPELSARRTASPALRGPTGLAVRLQRGSMAGWGIGAVLLGLIGGDLANLVNQQLAQAPGVTDAVRRLAGPGESLIDGFITAIASFVGILAAAIAVQGAMRLRQEEAAGGAETVLASPVGRVRWLLAAVAVAAVAAAGALVLAGLGAGIAATVASPDGSAGRFATWFGAIVWQLPAVLVLLGVVVVVFAVLPRATIPLGWLVLAGAAFLGELGALLDLPRWVRDLAPFTHSPEVASAHPSFAGAWWMAAIGVAAVAAGCLLFRQRDVAA